MSGWMVEPDKPHSSLVYRNDEGRVTAALSIDNMLLVGFHTPDTQAEIWEALCAEVTAMKGVRDLPKMVLEARILARDSNVARICAENPGIDPDEVKASVERNMIKANGLPEDYWETAQ